MSIRSSLIRTGILGVALAALAAPAVAAPFTATSAMGGSAQPPAGTSVLALTPYDLPAGVTYSLTADPHGVPNGIVSGNSVTNGAGRALYYSDPYVAPNDPYSGSYYSTAGGAITFNFQTPQDYLGLLWGSVDAGNSLSFYNGPTPLGTLFGSEIASNPDGAQDYSGTDYVNVDFTIPYDKVVATSDIVSFEFADIYAASMDPSATIPAPSSLALLGLGLLGLYIVHRRKTSLRVMHAPPPMIARTVRLFPHTLAGLSELPFSLE
jgi:hypothetical protein